ncbi:MAG: hypothetical protein AAB834_05820 [Patescibacteria group bacterium]
MKVQVLSSPPNWTYLHNALLAKNGVNARLWKRQQKHNQKHNES